MTFSVLTVVVGGGDNCAGVRGREFLESGFGDLAAIELNMKEVRPECRERGCQAVFIQIWTEL